MLVVSDTSPLSNLAIIGRLDLLRRRYNEIHIPRSVVQELLRLTRVEARKLLEAAMHDGWVIIDDSTSAYLSQLHAIVLDVGETAAINLSLAINADLLLIDEKKGREVARSHGLAIGGLLGELLYAKRRGWVNDLRSEIVRLRSDARFFVAPEIERLILKEAGE